jgi:hypothetical protein
MCFCVCVNSELGDSSLSVTHDCNMVVYHECRLVIGNFDMFQMSLDLCRFCLDDYVVSIMFFRLMFSRWCLLACKSILSTPRCRKTPCVLMKYKMRPFA